MDAVAHLVLDVLVKIPAERLVGRSRVVLDDIHETEEKSTHPLVVIIQLSLPK